MEKCTTEGDYGTRCVDRDLGEQRESSATVDERTDMGRCRMRQKDERESRDVSKPVSFKSYKRVGCLLLQFGQVVGIERIIPTNVH